MTPGPLPLNPHTLPYHTIAIASHQTRPPLSVNSPQISKPSRLCLPTSREERKRANTVIRRKGKARQQNSMVSPPARRAMLSTTRATAWGFDDPGLLALVWRSASQRLQKEREAQNRKIVVMYVLFRWKPVIEREMEEKDKEKCCSVVNGDKGSSDRFGCGGCSLTSIGVGDLFLRYRS